jgi:hypothetical protein
MGVAVAVHVLRYAPTEPPIPSGPPLHWCRRNRPLCLFVSVVSKFSDCSTNADSPIGLHPLEIRGFVGRTLHGFIDLGASFGDLGMYAGVVSNLD